MRIISYSSELHETKKRSISIVLRGILVNAEFSRITFAIYIGVYK